jgi:hypothetical protein
MAAGAVMVAGALTAGGLRPILSFCYRVQSVGPDLKRPGIIS